MEKELAQIADAYMKDVESVCLHMMQELGVSDKDALMEYHDIQQTGEFYIDGEMQKYYFHGLGCIYQNSRLHINWEFGTEDTWCGISPSCLLGYIQKNAIETERSYDVAYIEKEFEQAVSCGEWIKRWDLYYKVDDLQCYYGENNRIEQTAERLLGRALFPTEGIRNSRIISETELKLHVTLPNALKRFYYFVGRQEIFMSSFQQIIPPDALWCDGNHLFFAKENQEVCLWSVDLADLQVYQNVEGSRYPEEISLEDFLLLLMYYNFAEKGYEYSETKEYSGNVENMKLDDSWEQVVHHNGLVIYEGKDSLLLFFYDTSSGEIICNIRTCRFGPHECIIRSGKSLEAEGEMYMDNEWKIQYHEEFRKFLDEMNCLQDERDSRIKNILEGVCSLLEISGMVVWFYETPMLEARGQGEFIELYGTLAEQAGEVCMQHRHVTGEENIVRYDVYAKGGENAWTERQKTEISTLIDTIYSFHGRIRTSRIAERLTFWDADFGLHNLRYFMKTVAERIAKNQLVGYVACVFNLKRFSVVNDLVGRDVGTQIMIRYAKGLEAIFDSGDQVSHLGGDNFVTLFPLDKLEQVEKYFRGVLITYDASSNESVFVSASAGFYVISDMDGIHGPNDVMEGAYTSANMARKSGKTDMIFWDEQIKERQFQKKKIEDIFPSALENEEFQVYYQPKFLLKNQYRLVGAEALCRWIHKGNMIYPDNFIPILEQSINICKLDFYMLDHVCKDIKRWIDSGENVVKVSVNLSRKHLTDPNLLKHIIEIIDKNQVPHKYIEIELTETTTDVDFRDLKRVANGLHECGISTSVDDFGMGYSSLNLIRDVPWDVLKVDKSFLPETEDSNDDASKKNVMLKHIIEMAQGIGLQCIVEGVETEEHIQLLKRNHCYLAQGYYFDKPLPVEVFEKRLKL